MLQLQNITVTAHLYNIVPPLKKKKIKETCIYVILCRKQKWIAMPPKPDIKKSR